MRYPSICFVAQKAHGVLANKPSIYLGGVEVQIPLMAQWFAERGYDVSVVTWDEGYGDESRIGLVRLISMCKESDGVPGIRFFSPRWTSLNSALTRARPDVIYYNYGDMVLGQIALWAKPRGIPLVYSVPNDMVCRLDLPTLGPIRERYLYRYGLQNSDLVIAQTQFQKDQLSSDFDIQARVIPMPSEGFSAPDSRAFPNDSPPRIIWVGRFTAEKRLEWLLDIAELLPEMDFQIVGGTSFETGYSRSLSIRADSLPNVELKGRVLHQEMEPLYQEATILCSTSTYEGFPNVFLEAWSTGLPVVATFDPDNIIQRLKLGRVGNTPVELANGILELTDPGAWQAASEASLNYFQSRHRPELVMNQFREVIDKAYSLKVERTGVGLPIQLVKNNEEPILVDESSVSRESRPRFSLVTATYQRCEEIQALLGSIVQQIETEVGRYEHIICDNASTDNTAEVVSRYIKEHDHIAIRYYRQSENYGLDKNIQDALRLARGDYVWFIADDDDIAPGKLSYVADTCEQLQLPLVIVRANNIADWDEVPALEESRGVIVIDPTARRWASRVYATSFLASMVFKRDGIERFQEDLASVYGTNYTPWGLGLRIMSNASKLGYIDELCTLGNANFDGKNRFPPYRTLVKGRVQVWDRCGEGGLKKALKPHLLELSASGWRALAAGKLDIAASGRAIIKEFFQMYQMLGARVLTSSPWVLTTFLLPRRLRTWLDNLRIKVTK